MFECIGAHPAGTGSKQALANTGRAGLVLAAAVIGSLLAGCSAAPASPFGGADPSEAEANVPPSDYQSVIGAFHSRRPAAPQPWRQQNERAAPLDSGGG